MSLDVSNPNFQVNLGYVQLLKVEIKLETTQRHSVNEGSILLPIFKCAVVQYSPLIARTAFTALTSSM